MNNKFIIIGTTKIINNENIIENVETINNITEREEHNILHILNDEHLLSFPNEIYSGIDRDFIERIYSHLL